MATNSKIVNGLASIGKVSSSINAVIAVVLTVLICAAGIYFLVAKDRTVALLSTVRTADCTRVRTSSGNEHYDCDLTVDYAYAGRPYSAQVRKTSVNRTAAGNRVSVRVDPANPAKAEDRPSYDTIGKMLLVGASLMGLAAIVSVLGAVWARKSKTVAAAYGADALVDVFIRR